MPKAILCSKEAGLLHYTNNSCHLWPMWQLQFVAAMCSPCNQEELRAHCRLLQMFAERLDVWGDAEPLYEYLQ